jgi:8-oxo-dGTP diphosphatase
MRTIGVDLIIPIEGKIVLIKRGHEPYKGKWALPGGRLEDSETIEECAVREGKEETGLDLKLKKLVGVFSKPSRDPRGIVGICFEAKVIGGTLKAGDDAEEFILVEPKKALEIDLAFDHKEIIKQWLEGESCIYQ